MMNSNYLKNDDELQSYFYSQLSSLKLSQILFKLMLCRAALNKYSFTLSMTRVNQNTL